MAEEAGQYHGCGVIKSGCRKGYKMSDLRPNGVEIEIGGQKRKLLFTINAIDEIQEKCNMPLYDAVKNVARAADGKTDHDTLQNFRSVITILLNDGEEEALTEKAVGEMIDIGNYSRVAWLVLEAYGISMPDPDEADDEEEDEEDEAPNAGTGR